jgi:predicted DCC family thiol-disulfide oxidoreductase YuxK
LITYPIPWFGLAVIVAYLLLVPVGFWLGISNAFKSNAQSYTFYYDAECPLCNKVVVVIRHFDVFNKINCVTVQGYAANEVALNGIPEIDLLINIHGVDSKGKVSVGFDAYIGLFKHMIYMYPLGIFASLPGISAIGRRIYKYVAGNRLTERCTSENCMMPVFSAPMSETEDFLVKGWNKFNITKQFWKCVIIVMISLQLVIIGLCPLFSPYLDHTPVGNALAKCYAVFGMPAKKGFGITTHPVFMDGHFKNYNHIFKIVCNNNNEIVPLLDENGMVTNSYANGAFWVHYTFRTSAPALFKEEYEMGVVKYLRYFENRHGLAHSEYTIYVKELDSPGKWKKDFLRDQIKKQWQSAGSCKLTPNAAAFEWNEKMEAVFAKELATPRVILR